VDGTLTNGIAIVLSVAAVVASTVIGIGQVRLMRHTNSLIQHSNLVPVLNDSFREFREQEFKQHMQYIETRLWDQCPHEQSTIRDLPEEAKVHVTPVMSFFGHVGTLLANGIISDQLIASYMGPTALTAWKYLAPYIRNERRQNPNYYLYFENLASVVEQYPPGKLREQLNLKAMPGSSAQNSKANCR
jgi:Domain of unknown function (DUF4760)